MQKRSNRLICRARLWFFLCAILLSATPVFAEWYKDYDAGLRAIQKSDWQEAISKLQNAIHARKDEAINIRFYGTKMDDYLPHFYLGLAYYNAKQYSSAINEFRISEQQGAVTQRQRLANQLKSLQTLARAQLASGNSGAVSTPPKTYEVPVVPPAPQQQEPAPTSFPPAEQPTIEKEKEEAKKEKTEPQPDPEAFKKSMRSGVRRYFEGNYDAAIRSFASAVNLNPKEAGAYFFLGCSYASKYLLSGSQDQKLFEKASSAFQKSKRIDPQYRAMNNTYISPAVVEIYQKTSG